MRIIDKYIQASKLTILFDEPIDVDVVTVGIDNAYNYHNNIANRIHDAGYSNVQPLGRAIEITAPTDLAALVVVTIYIGDTVYTTMFLNQYMLFRAQNKHLAGNTTCNNACASCDEKTWRTNTLAILLRTRLLEYAYTNDLLNDAIDLYNDLTRVLTFDGIAFESIPAFYNNLDSYGDTLV